MVWTRRASLLIVGLTVACGNTANIEATGGAAGAAGMAGATGTAGAAGAAACGSAKTGDKKFDDYVATVRALANDMHAPGGIVTVVDNGPARIAWFGSKRSDTCDPLDEHTLFSMPRVGQVLTAIAVQRQKMDLDAPVTNWTPDLKLDQGSVAPASAMTLRDLLSFNAYASIGWGPVPGGSCPSNNNFPSEAQTSDDSGLAALFDNWTGSISAKPGSMHLFSSADFALAGRALEVASGKSYVQAMQDLVLAPAGFDGTFDRATAATAGDFAPGTLGDCAALRANWGLYASASDLAKVVEALANGGNDSFSAQEVDAVLHAGTTNFVPDADAAMAFITTPLPPYGTLAHRSNYGGGYMNSISTVAEAHFAVGVSVNAQLPLPNEMRFLQAAIDAYLPDFKPYDHSLPADQWSDYAGDYTLGGGTAATITVDATAGRLVVDGTVGHVELSPVGQQWWASGLALGESIDRDVFGVPHQLDAEVGRFYRDSSGQVVAFAGEGGPFNPPWFKVK